jgi:DNA-binding winged helix-turn-helix (wHTH) protein/Flp pilus assembly protein TadD
VRFAGFELDPANHVLRQQGTPVKLAPQPFKLLTVLVSRPGELVTREELCRAVWPGDVTVDFEHGLNSCIRQIRTALGDDAETARIIETVPRVGYRLKVPVTPAGATRVPVRRAAMAASVALAVVLLAWWAGRREVARIESARLAGELNAQAHAALAGHTAAGTTVARQLFERSIAIDPGSAEAHAGIARSYFQIPSSLPGLDPHEAHAKGTDAAARALSVGPDDPAAHTALAEAMRAAHDWAGAVREHRRAIELGPNDPATHFAYAQTIVVMGEFDAAIGEQRRAAELDPLSAVYRSAVAASLRFARRYDDAIVEARHALELDPTYGPAYHTLGQCYEATGRLQEAIGYYERDGQPGGNRGHAYAVAGRTADARKLIATFEARYQENGTGAGEIAMVYLGLGERDRAFEWLDRAVAVGNPLTLKVADVWDPLRADPRFEPLLERLGLGNELNGLSGKVRQQ